MPTYVYECKNCQHRFEIFQSFKADPLDTCPECEAIALRKVLFPAGVVFKGAGFYVNDSRASSSRPSTREKSESGSDPGKKEGKGREGKGKDSASADESKPKKEPAASAAGNKS